MWTIVGGIPYLEVMATRERTAMNIYADIEMLKSVVEDLTNIQGEFDDREIDFSEAIARINSARATLSDITADIEQ